MSGLKVTRIGYGRELPLAASVLGSVSGDDVDWESSALDATIIVAEGDGTPTVAAVHTVVFDEAGFTVTDDGGGQVTITALGGSIPAGTYVLATDGGEEVLQSHGAMGATETVDLADGNYHQGTLDADCTLTFAAVTSGVLCSFVLELTEDGTGGWQPTWPGSVTWIGGTAPTHDDTASSTTLYGFLTTDGGTNWIGYQAGGGGGSGTPATTVTDETTWGISPAVGTDTEYARQDHTHGSPAQPTGGGTELLVADISGGTSGVLDSSYVEMTTQRTTTSATLVDITGASTTITLTRAADIAVFLNCEVSASGASADIGLAVNIDGTDHDVTITHLSAAASDNGVSGIVHRTASPLAPGTYTVKGRFKRAAGAGTPAVDRADLLVTSMGTGGPVTLTTDDGSDWLYADA